MSASLPPQQQRIAEMLTRAPATTADLARLLGWDRSLVSSHLEAMRRCGRARRGGTVTVSGDNANGDKCTRDHRLWQLDDRPRVRVVETLSLTCEDPHCRRAFTAPRPRRWCSATCCKRASKRRMRVNRLTDVGETVGYASLGTPR